MLAALRNSSFFSLPHSGALVKNFFQKFLNSPPDLSAATFVGYHILWLLSSGFFIPLSGAVLTAPTALLEYQTFPRLSTPFLRFLLFQTFPTFLLYREVEVISKSNFLHSEGPQYKPHAAIDCCTVSSLFRRFPIHSTTNSNHASPDWCKNIDNEIQIFFRLSSVINVFSIPYTPQKRDRQIHIIM